MEQAVDRLLAFMLASALECADQPSPYGALRLLESAQQLIAFVLAQGLVDSAVLAGLEKRIAEEKGCALQNREEFRNLIEACALALVECG